MEEQPQDVKNPPVPPDDELHELMAKHHELEGRLHELIEKPYLSTPEQLEEVTIKKLKLQLKDRMEELRRRTGPSRLERAQAHG